MQTTNKNVGQALQTAQRLLAENSSSLLTVSSRVLVNDLKQAATVPEFQQVAAKQRSLKFVNREEKERIKRLLALAKQFDTFVVWHCQQRNSARLCKQNGQTFVEVNRLFSDQAEARAIHEIGHVAIGHFFSDYQKSIANISKEQWRDVVLQEEADVWQWTREHGHHLCPQAIDQVVSTGLASYVGVRALDKTDSREIKWPQGDFWKQVASSLDIVAAGPTYTRWRRRVREHGYIGPLQTTYDWMCSLQTLIAEPHRQQMHQAFWQRYPHLANQESTLN